MKTLLIVDDKQNAVRLLADYLAANGFRTVTAGNGRQALFVARYEKPDLVLLDIMMPEMDGLEFMRHFRKERNTPVIMLTAKVDETDKVVGLELGADDYVTKPFGMAERCCGVFQKKRHANQLRKQMTADIAHDLRTPLMVISGYLEALRDGTLPPRLNASTR